MERPMSLAGKGIFSGLLALVAACVLLGVMSEVLATGQPFSAAYGAVAADSPPSPALVPVRPGTGPGDR